MAVILCRGGGGGYELILQHVRSPYFQVYYWINHDNHKEKQNWIQKNGDALISYGDVALFSSKP